MPTPPTPRNWTRPTLRALGAALCLTAGASLVACDGGGAPKPAPKIADGAHGLHAELPQPGARARRWRRLEGAGLRRPG